MRIAFYAPLKAPTHPVPSGDRRMAQMLMAALRAAGHRVDPACALRTLDHGKVAGRQARLRDLGRRAARLLVRRWRDAPPDLWFTYHLYHKAPDWTGPAVADALGIPYVVAEASHAPKQAHGPWAEGHAAAEAAIRRADRVLAITAADTGCLARIVAPDRLVRLAPFLDPAPFSAAAAERPAHRAALAARLGLPADEPWLVAVGMMRDGDKSRSWHLLARALERLRPIPWRLLAVGDGPRRDDIEAAFAHLDPGRVRFLGGLAPPDLAACCAACDLMVWPAVNEAYGMALLEGQAAGLPVVAGRTGGVPDVVADGVTGLLPPVGDADAFAAAMAELLRDPVRRAAMSAAARTRIADVHGFGRAVSVLDAVVREVCG
ncbi:MAG TPA: glycosyltransferase family 4 protein [Azospirillaceae bacterium]|nr:glycosyltransferase family 4 protein [Azospirillaceae bacterium]